MTSFINTRTEKKTENIGARNGISRNGTTHLKEDTVKLIYMEKNSLQENRHLR